MGSQILLLSTQPTTVITITKFLPDVKTPDCCGTIKRFVCTAVTPHPPLQGSTAKMVSKNMVLRYERMLKLNLALSGTGNREQGTEKNKTNIDENTIKLLFFNNQMC